MTYNSTGKRITSENLAGQVTTTAWDCCHKVSENRSDVYGYNLRGELVSATKNTEDTEYAYTYDDIGNRLTSLDLGTNRTYTANNFNQYTLVGRGDPTAPEEEFVPQFDDDGNQTLIKTSTGIWSVTYNGENRPTFWTCIQSNNSNNTNNQTISMSYDRMGRRVTKNDQRFVYNGYLQIANFEESVTNSQLTTHNSQLFIWDPTEPVATRPLAWNFSTFQPFNLSTSYYTHDGNKNVSEIVSESGDVTAHYEYASFGAVVIQSGEYSGKNPWRYSGEYACETTGLIVYNYRNFDSFTARWLNRDTFEDISPALYAYCRNSPVDCFDLLGLQSVTGYIDYNAYNALVSLGDEMNRRRKEPSIIDQMSGARNNFDRHYEEYFDTRYHNTMEWYRNDIRFKVSSQVDCKTSVLELTSHSRQIQGGTVNLPFQENSDGEAIGDPQQGWWERNMSLGTFTIDIKPVNITYTSDCTNGKRNYTWKTKMFILDSPGLQPEDGLKYKFFVGVLGVFEPGRLKLAEWNLSGSGSCSCCEDGTKGKRRRGRWHETK